LGENAVEVIVRFIGFSSAIAAGTGEHSSVVAAAVAATNPICPKTRAMTSRRFAVVEVEHSVQPSAPVNRVPGEFVVKRVVSRNRNDQWTVE
jgi:hypothetical protein